MLPAAQTMSNLPLPKPLSNRDFNFFYAGLAQGRLLVQRCGNCGRLRNPPGPMCSECHSLEWEEHALSGRGCVYSYTVHHHPRLPHFDTPHVVALVQMVEGVRVVGALAGTAPDEVRIGMPVWTEFVQRGETPTFQFRA